MSPHCKKINFFSPTFDARKGIPVAFYSSLAAEIPSIFDSALLCNPTKLKIYIFFSIIPNISLFIKELIADPNSEDDSILRNATDDDSDTCIPVSNERYTYKLSSEKLRKEKEKISA